MATPRKTTTTKKTPTAARTSATAATAKTAATAVTTGANPAPAPATEKTGAEPGQVVNVMRKKQFIDAVTARSGVKKKFAKPAVEAALAVLGEALSKGEELVLPPMGRVKVQREIDKPNAKVMVLRMRQTKGNKPAPKDPLAEAAE